MTMVRPSSTVFILDLIEIILILPPKQPSNLCKINLQITPELKGSGVSIYSGDQVNTVQFFLPIQLDLKLLIEEYPDYKDQALQPLSDALDKIKKSSSCIWWYCRKVNETFQITRKLDLIPQQAAACIYTNRVRGYAIQAVQTLKPT